MSVIFCLLSALICCAPPAHATAPMIAGTAATVHFRHDITFTLHGHDVAAAELHLRYPQSATEDVRPATLTRDAGQTTAAVTVDPAQVGLSGGATVNYRWVVRDGAGRTATADGSVAYEDTRFAWQQWQTGFVTLRWYVGDGPFVNLIERTTNDALTAMHDKYGLAPSAPIFVTIYATRADFFTDTPALPEWVGGDAVPQTGEINTYLAGDASALWRIGEVIPHELSHMLVYQWTHHAAPLWLDEGLAVTNQAATSINYPAYLERARAASALLPLPGLERAFPAAADDALLAYAESRSVVGFLIDHYGADRVGALVRALRHLDMDAALQRTFGLDTARLQEAWLNSLYDRPPDLPPVPPLQPDPPPSTASLPPPARISAVAAPPDSTSFILGLAIIGLCIGAGGCVAWRARINKRHRD